MESLQKGSLFQDLNAEESAIVSGGLFPDFRFDTYATGILTGLILGVPSATTQFVSFFKGLRQY